MMHLRKEDRKVLCNHLSEKFLTVFQTGEYTSEKNLQNDFQELRSNLKRYRKIIDFLLKDNPLKSHLTWRDVKITAQRWHLCKVCGKPFIAYDAYNKMKICTRQDYVRYNISANKYYKSAGKSMCYMIYRRQIS